MSRAIQLSAYRSCQLHDVKTVCATLDRAVEGPKLANRVRIARIVMRLIVYRESKFLSETGIDSSNFLASTSMIGIPGFQASLGI